MKVVIAGVGGQVGRALLSSAPATVQVVGLGHRELDVGDPAAVLRILSTEKPGLVINVAAYTAVDRAEDESQLAERVNVNGARHLADSARAVGARVIHVSTDFVFDGLASEPYAPDSPTNPLSVYGRTKRLGEQAVLAALPIRSVVLRTAWVYAEQGSNFVLTMLRLMKQRKSLGVVVDQIGTPTSAHSLASIIWALSKREDIHGLQHWTDAGVASWYDFAVAIAEDGAARNLVPEDVHVRPIATEEYPTRARRPKYSVLDKRTLAAALNIEPVHWRKSLRNVLGAIENG